MQASTQNILHAGQPSQSALRVATLRAAHQLVDDPIVFRDPLAMAILDRNTREAIRRDPLQFNQRFLRGLRAALVARSRAAEDELAHAVEAGIKQYVILGAGLDTFGYRNPFEQRGLQVFEVDHPSTQHWKKALLAEAAIKIPASMRFAAIDFESDTLAHGLQRAGFRAEQAACFAWLGVSMYLSAEAVFQTLHFIATLPRGSAVIFDYRVAADLLETRERAIDDRLRVRLAQQGEPWKSSFDPAALQAGLRRAGFRETEDFAPADLNARYFAQRKDGLQTGGGFRVMCAKT